MQKATSVTPAKLNTNSTDTEFEILFNNKPLEEASNLTDVCFSQEDSESEEEEPAKENIIQKIIKFANVVSPKPSGRQHKLSISSPGEMN